MTHPTILILDSGIGGLSIARDIRQQVPASYITYIADIDKFPYGQKTEEEVMQRVTEIVNKSISLFQPDLVVIACNTASTLVLDQLRKLFHIPFIGVVPAIKPAASLTHTGVIGVLATKGTVNRRYTNDLILKFAQNKEVHLHGSSVLVTLAEQKLQNTKINRQELEADVSILMRQSQKMDTVVLACTHFPIIKQELKQSFSQIKYWVDSGEAIARRTSYWLDQLEHLNHYCKAKQNVNRFITTAPTPPYNRNKIAEYLGVFQMEVLIM